MKKILYVVLCYFTITTAVDVDAKKTKSIGMSVSVMGTDEKAAKKIAKTIRLDLNFTGQFSCALEKMKTVPTQEKMRQYRKNGDLLLTVAHENSTFNCSLFNVNTGASLAKKSVEKKGLSARGWGHAIADEMLKSLTNKEGSFSTKIVYCREEMGKNDTTKICVSDYDGRYESVIVDPKSTAIAPRWNGDTHHPLIMYSEYTSYNIRLMATDLHGNAKVATSFDGLNMLPAFSQDRSEAVVCLSVEGSSQLYSYTYNKKHRLPEYIRLTNNEGSNLSPSILKNGDIVLCSDYETKRPQIYIMNRKTKKMKRVSNGGCCTSPAYSSVVHKIAYSKIVDGVSQIMVYDLARDTTEQITQDLAHKEEASWSPCGNYLVYSVNDTHTKRLAVQNLLTNKRRFITGSQYRYSYPSWSPVYSIFPAAA